MENIEFDDIDGYEGEYNYDPSDEEEVIIDLSDDDSEEEYNEETAEVDDGDEEPEEIEPPEPFNRFTPDDDDTAEDPPAEEDDGEIVDIEEEGESGEITPVEDDSDDTPEEEDIETEEEDETIFIEEFIHEDDIVVGDDDDELDDEEPEEEDISDDEEPEEPGEPEEELPLIELAEEEPYEEEAVPIIEDEVVIPDDFTYDPSEEEVIIDFSEDDSDEEYNEQTDVTPSESENSEEQEEETEDEENDEETEEEVEYEEGVEYTEDPYAIYDEELIVETDEGTESEPEPVEEEDEEEETEGETEYEPDPEPSEEPVEEYDPDLDDMSDDAAEEEDEEEEIPPEPIAEENNDVEEDPDYYLIEFQTDEPIITPPEEPIPEPSDAVILESADEPEDEPEEDEDYGYALGTLYEEFTEEETESAEGDEEDEEIIEVVDTEEEARIEEALGYDDEEEEEGVGEEEIIEDPNVEPEPDEDEEEVIEDDPEANEGNIQTVTVIDTVASLPNAKHFAVEELSVNVGHIQDLHGYDAPWGAGQRTNIGKLSSTNVSAGAYYTAVYDDTGVTVTPTTASGRVGYLFNVTDGVTYTVSYKAVGNGFDRIYYANENNVWDSESSGYLGYQVITDTLSNYSYTFTATASGEFFFGIYAVSNSYEGETGHFLTVTEFQLEVGSEITPFSPYANICPIEGHSKTVIRRSGVNLCESIQTWDSVTVDNTVLWAEFDLHENTQYTISFVGMVDNQLYLNPLIFETGTVTVVSGRTSIQATTLTGLDKNDVYQYQPGYGWAIFRNYILQNNSNVFTDVQIEYGDTASDYEQTNIEALEISWGEGIEKVFDGVLNVKTGVFTVLNEEIESYSGEELPSTWISDRDAYVEGTTPSLGAQVVYEYEEPMTILIPQYSLNLLGGQNYIWADTGDVNVTYRTAESFGDEIEEFDEPTEPDEPDEPTEPTEPDEPNEPEEPNDGDEPDEPYEPYEPDEPLEDEPDEPNEPNGGEEPNEPNEPIEDEPGENEPDNGEGE